MKIEKELLKEAVPSAYATHPQQDVSEKYQFISTEKVIDDLYNLGWYASSAKQDKPTKNNPTFVKHMLKFRKDDLPIFQDITPEFIWINSHNRSFQAIGAFGAYRSICSNGLFVPIVEMFKLKTKHMGEVASQLSEAVIEMVKNTQGVYERIEDYQKVNLTQPEKEDFVNQAAQFSWRNRGEFKRTDLLTPKRTEDEGDDLWTVFNVVQENIMKGGLSYKTGDKQRNTKTKGIREIRREFNINVKLWYLMDQFCIARS